jgi:hypothetical protein
VQGTGIETVKQKRTNKRKTLKRVIVVDWFIFDKPKVFNTFFWMNEDRTKTILSYDRQFDVENWFNFIPNETFNTKFISLTKEEATNLLIYMKTCEKS